MPANLSDERRATALRWIHGEGLLTDRISEGARVTAVVALLTCNEVGAVSKADLDAALADPSVIQVARSILQEARG